MNENLCSMLGEKDARVEIFGCGNPLLGDDGFGSAVVRELEGRQCLGREVLLEDVGTGIRERLFDYLLEPSLCPGKLIIIDCFDQQGKIPGEVFLISPGSIPVRKIHDFSLHQFPTVNMLAEISQCTGTSVHVIAVKPGKIPDHVCPGLSGPVKSAVPRACALVRRLVS